MSGCIFVCLFVYFWPGFLVHFLLLAKLVSATDQKCVLKIFLKKLLGAAGKESLYFGKAYHSKKPVPYVFVLVLHTRRPHPSTNEIKTGSLIKACIKGIFSDSNNIFLWHESGDINKIYYFQNFSWFKGPYADHILIPQGSTWSSIFFYIKWKPIFFWLQIQNFGFKFFVVLEI